MASLLLALAALVAAAGAEQSPSAASAAQAALSNPGPTAGDPDGDSLPFTGFDLILLVSGGLLLVGAGAATARLVPRVEGL